MARARTWIMRVAFGLVALIAVAVVVTVITLHTDYGRDLIRGQVEDRILATFVGGGSVGAVEGSVFSELTLRDTVINGPDGKPAITIGTLKLRLALMPLVSKQARITGLVAEDVDVVLARTKDGDLQISQLMRPADKSGWSVAIPEIRVRRAHVAIATGTELGVVNLDDVMVHGAAHVPVKGALAASLSIRGSWRERAAPIGLDAVVHSDEGVTSIASITALLGGVTVAGSAIRFSTHGAAPEIEGMLVINAPSAAVTGLVPEIVLPADLAFAITASQDRPWTRLSLIGLVGATPVRAMLSANLATRRVLGVVGSGDLELATLTQDKLAGRGAGLASFDATLGARPVAAGVITAWGKIDDAPAAEVAVAFTMDGDRANAIVGVHGEAARGMVAAEVVRAGDAISLVRSTLIASTTNPRVASGGVAPIRGSFDVRLSGHGSLSPAIDLAVTGRVRGKRISAEGFSAAALDLAIDARGLPERPRGKLELRLADLIGNDMHLGALEVDAANRADGRIQVAVRSRPKRAPWLVDVDALVTPPGKGDTVVVDVQRHHVRAAGAGDWYGSTGRIEINRKAIVVSDLASASTNSTIRLAGRFDHAGRNAGDLAAKIDVTCFALHNLDRAYRGTVDAHVDVTRKGDRFAGTADVRARGVATDPAQLPIHANLTAKAAGDRLVIAANASSPRLGKASLAFDVRAPEDITKLDKWKHLHRDVIRDGRLRLEGIDLAELATLAGRTGDLAGRVDGELEFNQATAGGVIELRDVKLPGVRAVDRVTATLRLSRTAPDELGPVLTGTIGGIGAFEASARLWTPDHMFDPAAWRALGGRAVRGARVKLPQVALERGLFERFGWTTNLHGNASLSAELSEAMQTARIAVDLRDLRGTRISEPVNAQLAVTIDGTKATASAAVVGRAATLLEVRGAIPVTLDQLRADPRAVLALPVQLTASFPNTSAPALLKAFGRNEMIGGTITGTIAVAGTVGNPTFQAAVVGTGLRLPAGSRERPVKAIDRITIDATWDGTIGTLAVKGTQEAGSLDLVATGSPRALARGTLTVKATSFDLAPLLVFAPGPAAGSAGRLDANFTVRGLDPETARVTGDLHLTHARIPVAPNVGTLRRARLDVTVGARAMRIALEGRLGGGDVKLKSTIMLDGAKPTGGSVTMTLRKVSLIGAIEPDIDANIKVKLSRRGPKWIADVAVRDGVIKVPSGRGQSLKPAGAPSDMVFASGETLTRRTPRRNVAPDHPTLVANITIHPTQVESTELRGIIRGKVAIAIDDRDIGITGTIEADRGDLVLFGRRYQVEKAAVRFDGSTDPLLDLRITHDFQSVTTITVARGRLSAPELEMSSNPGLYSQGQLLGFLLGGEPSGDPQLGSARDTVASAGTSIIANRLGGYVRKALPFDIDVLRYETATASSSAAITVGSWLSRSLFVSYRQRLEARPDENSAEGEAEYWLTRRVMVEAIVGDAGINGIDLLWRKRY